MPSPMFWKMCGSVGEGRLADPVGALGAHLRHRERAALGQPDRHAVAADAALRERALGHDGRRVVRAARAEAREAHEAGRRGARAARGGRAQAPRELGRAALEPARGAPRRRSPGASSPSDGTSGAPRLVALAEEPRAALAVVEQRARAAPRSPAASPRRRARPRGPSQKRRAPSRLERPGHRDLVDGEAELARRARRRCRARRAPGARRGRPCPW